MGHMGGGSHILLVEMKEQVEIWIFLYYLTKPSGPGLEPEKVIDQYRDTGGDSLGLWLKQMA